MPIPTQPHSDQPPSTKEDEATTAAPASFTWPNQAQSASPSHSDLPAPSDEEAAPRRQETHQAISSTQPPSSGPVSTVPQSDALKPSRVEQFEALWERRTMSPPSPEEWRGFPGALQEQNVHSVESINQWKARLNREVPFPHADDGQDEEEEEKEEKEGREKWDEQSSEVCSFVFNS